MTLKIENLTGGYGRVPVIHDINFEVLDGEIVGLIGLNGAGKSTIIKHVIGLLRPMKGAVTIGGVSLEADSEQYRKSFTYMPEFPIIYEELTLREHLELVAMAYGIPLEIAMRRAQPLLETFRLTDRLDWLPVHFSKGMKQKVMILSSMIVDADAYIIDEPFLGLDPLATYDFIHLLKEKKAEGKVILMSTHLLASAQEYCDRFVFIKDGHLAAFGDITTIQEKMGLPGYSLEDLYIQMARGEQA